MLFDIDSKNNVLLLICLRIGFNLVFINDKVILFSKIMNKFNNNLCLKNNMGVKYLL